MQDDAVAHGLQAHGVGLALGQVGQEGLTGAGLGVPRREAVPGGLDGQGVRAPDGQVRGRPDAQLARAGVVQPGEPPPAAGVGAERGPCRDALHGVLVGEGGAHGLPGVERGDGGVGAERERHARPGEVGERRQGRRAAGPEPGGVHAVAAAPRGVERGLHRQRHPVQQQRGQRGRVHEQGVLEPVVARAQQARAVLGGGELQPAHHLVHGPVSDDVEPALRPRGRAGGEVRGDVLGGEEEPARGLGAARRGEQVAVRVAQRGGARADRPVGAQVAGDAGEERQLGEHLPGVVRRRAQLAPVGDDVRQRPRRVRGEGHELREPLAGVHVRLAHLVHADDAARGGVREGAPVRAGAARGRDLPHRGGRGVVGVGGDHPGRLPADDPVEAGRAGERPGHDGRVAVDPRRVHAPPAAGRVELVRRGGAPLGPGLLVPPEREQHLLAARIGGVELARTPGEGLERRRERRRAARGREVDGLGREAGLQQVHVRVDEPGRHEGAVQVDHAVGAGREAGGGVLRAEPGHDAVVDEQGLGEGVGGRVDDSVAVQGGRHGLHSMAPSCADAHRAATPAARIPHIRPRIRRPARRPSSHAGGHTLE